MPAETEELLQLARKRKLELDRIFQPSSSDDAVNPANPSAEESKPENRFGSATKSRKRRLDLSLHYFKTGERPQNFIQMKDEKPQNATKKTIPSISLPIGASLAVEDFHGVKFDSVLLLLEGHCNNDDREIWEDLKAFKIKDILEKDASVFLCLGSRPKDVSNGYGLIDAWGLKSAEEMTILKTNKNRESSVPCRYTRKYRTVCHRQLPAAFVNKSLFHNSIQTCLIAERGNGTISNLNQLDLDLLLIEEDQQTISEILMRKIEQVSSGYKRISMFAKPSDVRSGWVISGPEIRENSFDAQTMSELYAQCE